MELNEKKTADEMEKTAENTADGKADGDPFKSYPERYERFKIFYLCIVVISFVGFMGAICIAIYNELLWGALVGAISFFIYYVFTANELIDKLGISYKTSVGSLEVNACRMRYGEVFFVPSRLLWYDVERIGDRAFCSPKNAELREIYIPKTIKSIGKDVFSSCDSLEAVRYEGSEEEWQAIENESELSGVAVTFGAVYPTSVKKRSNSVRKYL